MQVLNQSSFNRANSCSASDSMEAFDLALGGRRTVSCGLFSLTVSTSDTFKSNSWVDESWFKFCLDRVRTSCARRSAEIRKHWLNEGIEVWWRRKNVDWMNEEIKVWWRLEIFFFLWMGVGSENACSTPF